MSSLPEPLRIDTERIMIQLSSNLLTIDTPVISANHIPSPSIKQNGVDDGIHTDTIETEQIGKNHRRKPTYIFRLSIDDLSLRTMTLDEIDHLDPSTAITLSDQSTLQDGSSTWRTAPSHISFPSINSISTCTIPSHGSLSPSSLPPTASRLSHIHTVDGLNTGRSSVSGTDGGTMRYYTARATLTSLFDAKVKEEKKDVMVVWSDASPSTPTSSSDPVVPLNRNSNPVNGVEDSKGMGNIKSTEAVEQGLGLERGEEEDGDTTLVEHHWSWKYRPSHLTVSDLGSPMPSRILYIFHPLPATPLSQTHVELDGMMKQVKNHAGEAFWRMIGPSLTGMGVMVNAFEGVVSGLGNMFISPTTPSPVETPHIPKVYACETVYTLRMPQSETTKDDGNLDLGNTIRPVFVKKRGAIPDWENTEGRWWESWDARGMVL
ncbi:hypothetical protein TREMEDRAFT_60631 [Tremella mesenterica DSM 1558]|uniref:uncharacterized protein n=1 Tax=Tremella mesenterica (strain ATCC 24925 / CBS 8224 / DSM 1558 / NBRC 9311 / NRRL Y-6157 / RJB 2259-6 / UBC 559-6) TaxID=578456 RepID=UPI0003F49B02|nr:uncharacterized protein TREMEDRAFT_60631 [Tremella mesenterica DSM 1558]EIW71715.1 hypothetical protein TREMEDRAFT_60631 [Tremella mesenterica DSM 1558]